MASPDKKPVKLDVAAHSRLKELQKALTSHNLPPDVEYGDMVSALVMHTTPRQLADMLGEYWWFTERRASAESEDAESVRSE